MLLDKLTLVHEKSREIFSRDGLSNDIKKEYNGKVNQYRDMYSSLETMKEMSDSQETIDNLMAQQESVLKTWIAFEIDIMNRAAQELLQ